MIEQVKQRSDLPHNPMRDRVVREINEALEAFSEIRCGQRSEFIDSVGLQDDGEGSREIVTVANVDEQESQLRRKWSWLCPGLVDSEVAES